MSGVRERELTAARIVVNNDFFSISLKNRKKLITVSKTDYLNLK